MASVDADVPSFKIIAQDISLSFYSSPSSSQEKRINDLVDSVKPTSTKRSTKWGVGRFFEWQQQKGKDVNFETIKPESLNSLLRTFYEQLSCKDGSNISPSSLTGVRAAIHRYLTGPPLNRAFNIISDREFIPANRVFVAKCKSYYKTGNAKPKHKTAIQDGDMAKLVNYFDDGFQNPVILQQMVWFSLCFYFGRRGREGWRTMTKDSFTLKVDDMQKPYVTYGKTETTKNHQGGPKAAQQDYSDTRMYEIKYIEAYKFYLSKLHPENDALWQYAMKQFMKDEATWYTKKPVGRNTLDIMMQTISKHAGLSTIYTCHCVRATTVTKLFQNGATSKQIMDITNHRNESSLSHYINESSSKQKRETSAILSSALSLSSDSQALVPVTPNTSLQTLESTSSSYDVDFGNDDDALLMGVMDTYDHTRALHEVNGSAVDISQGQSKSVLSNCVFNNCSFTIQK